MLQRNHIAPDFLAWREALPPGYAFVRALIDVREVIEPAGATFAARRATGHAPAAIETALDAMRDAAGTVGIEGVVEATHSAIFSFVGVSQRNKFPTDNVGIWRL